MSNWNVFPAYHGIRLTEVDLQPSLATALRLSQPEDESLQPGDLPAVGEPPLPLQISSADIRRFRDPRVAAATHYGPPRQDKSSNEDFALSAVITTGGREEVSFSAVADGVSTGTFWAARAARISCFIAYKTACDCLDEGMNIGDEAAHRELAERLVLALNKAFAADSRLLTELKTIPSGWDPSVYAKYNADLSRWYRTTLLFGLVGPTGGVIGISGDGGVRGLLLEDREQADPTEISVAISEPGAALTSHVSLGVTESDFKLVPIRVRDRKQIHVILASDGLDESLLRYAPNEYSDGGRLCRSRYRDLPLNNGLEALAFLRRVAAREETVSDNLSVARVSWPLPEPALPWATWNQEDLSRWELEPTKGRQNMPQSAVSTRADKSQPKENESVVLSKKRTFLSPLAVAVLAVGLAALREVRRLLQG